MVRNKAKIKYDSGGRVTSVKSETSRMPKRNPMTKGGRNYKLDKKLIKKDPKAYAKLRETQILEGEKTKRYTAVAGATGYGVAGAGPEQVTYLANGGINDPKDPEDQANQGSSPTRRTSIWGP